MLFYADVRAFEKELHSEIERIVLQDDMPGAWTYPDIQPRLIQEALKRRAASAAAKPEAAGGDPAGKEENNGITKLRYSEITALRHSIIKALTPR